MAKLINSSTSDIRPLVAPYSIWRMMVLGVILGAFFCGLESFLASKISSNYAPGQVAAIITATAAVIAMLFLRTERILLVVISSSAVLWNLSQLTSGLKTVEALVWDMLIYGLTYMLFSWLYHHYKIPPAIVLSLIIVILINVAVPL